MLCRKPGISMPPFKKEGFATNPSRKLDIKTTRLRIIKTFRVSGLMRMLNAGYQLVHFVEGKRFRIKPGDATIR